MSKEGRKSLPKHEFLRDFKDNSNVGTNFRAEIVTDSLEIRCAIKTM
jgi:hypothetical protein